MTKNLIAEIPEKLHRALKRACFDEDIPMKAVVTWLVEKAVNDKAFFDRIVKDIKAVKEKRKL